MAGQTTRDVNPMMQRPGTWRERERAVRSSPLPPIVRLIHPAPALAVTCLSAALASILALQAGSDFPLSRVALTTVGVFGSQVLIGALNDWADRDRDAGRSDKPIAAGRVRPATALLVAVAGLALQLGASYILGPLALLLGAGASASAVAYDLWLSRTALSPLPYLVSFGLLPLWIAAGVGTPVQRVTPAAVLVAPFAVASHLANVLRDFDADAAAGSRNLAQLLGRRRAHRLAVGLAALTGIGIGVAFAMTGQLAGWSVALGVAGLLAIAVGARTPAGLWTGMLLAAIAWTAAWALSSA
jgi:4-hydroxybenzoate polyprenyltransferase